MKALIVDWLSWWLYVPDGRAGWLLPAWLTGLKHLRVNPPQVIFASAPSWTGLLVGYALSLTLGVPLVLDFRDPWCGSAFRTERVPYKTHRKVHELLERIVVHRAVHITCAWDGIRRLLIRRYPSLKGRITTVLNGFDPDDFSNLVPINLNKKRCIFLHVGSFYGPRSPIPLLKALKYMVDKDMCAITDALFVFLGQPTYNGYPLQAIIEQFSLSQYVRILPSVPQRKAFSYLKGSHVAMLFGQSGSDELASIPAKAYEYIGLHKPVLAIGCGDEVCAIMESGGCPVWRVDSASTVQMSELLNRIILNFQNVKLPHANSGAEKFTRLKMGERIRIILEGVVQ